MAPLHWVTGPSQQEMTGRFAAGYNTVAAGKFGSIAFGSNTKSSGDHGAIALGSNTIATGDRCVVVGWYNDTIVASGTDVTETSPLFIVGNGDAGFRSNALVVRKDGRTILKGALELNGPSLFSGRMVLNADEDTTSIHIGKRVAEFGNMPSSSGFKNTLIGSLAGRKMTSGSQNTFMGQLAGEQTTIGTKNSFYGNNSGQFNIAGSDNSFFGVGAGLSNNGHKNSFFGKNAGQNSNTGENNSFFGEDAGISATQTQRSTFLGSDSDQKNPSAILDRAIAIGFNAKVDCDNCAVIGGTGTDAVKVGIGVDSPSVHLTILGSESNSIPDMAITSQDALIELGIGKEGPHGFAFGDETIDNGLKLLYRSTPDELQIESGVDFTKNDPLVVFDANGNIKIKESLRDLAGSCIIGACSSDQRLKKNIRSIGSQLNLLTALNPVLYGWKDNQRFAGEEMGLIAQEVEQVIPEMVITGKDGTKKIKYDVSLQIRMIQSIKELKAENDKLKSEMKEIKDLLQQVISQ